MGGDVYNKRLTQKNKKKLNNKTKQDKTVTKDVVVTYKNIALVLKL